MRIFLDADACPNAIKEILFRAAERTETYLLLVANVPLKIPKSDYISAITVSEGPDMADDHIAESVEQQDLVITADIPLADRVVSKGALAINPRGELYSAENIKEKLATRNLMSELRDMGMDTGGPPIFSQKDSQKFANQLDRLLTSFNKG